MKKWYKISLASLVVPTVGSMALVAVGCGDKKTNDGSSTEPGAQNKPIPIPTLVENAKAYNDINQTVKAWCDANNAVTDMVKKVNVVNGFIKDNKLDPNQLNSVTFNANEADNTFNFSVIPAEGYVFQDTKSPTQYISTNIPYAVKVATPVLASNPSITQTGSLQEWWNSFGGDPVKEAEALNGNVFAPSHGLTANQVKVINFNPDTVKNTFTFDVTLKDGYVFSEQLTNTWSSKNSVSYISQVDLPTVLTDISGKAANATAWLDQFKDPKTGEIDKTKAINALFTKAPPVEYVESIEFGTPTANNTFTVKVTLKPGYTFGTTGKNTFDATITYTQSDIPLDDPTYDKAKQNIVATQENVTEWFKTLKTKEDKFNQFFKAPAGKTDYVNYIQDITITQIEGNKFSVRLLADKNHYFSSNNLQSLTIIGWTYTQQLVTPTLSDNLNVSGSQSTVNAWWSVNFGDVSVFAQVTEINTLLTKDGQLNSTKVKSVTIAADEAKKTFTFTVTLNNGYVFVDGKPTWTSPKSIQYAQKIAPMVMVDHPTITSTFASASNWWDSLGSLDVKVGQINTVLSPNSLLDASWVESIIPTITGRSFKVEIKLKPGFQFSDGTTSWTTNVPIMYICKLPIPTVTGKVVGTQTDVYEFRDALNGNIPKQLEVLNKVFSYQLTQEQVSSIMISVSYPWEFNVSIDLAGGYIFDNGRTWAFLENIEYSVQQVTPKLNNNPIIYAPEADLNAWWNANKDNVSAQVAVVNKALDPSAQLNPVAVKSIQLNTLSDPHKFNVTVNLNDHFAFTNGLTKWSSPMDTAITYNKEVQIPEVVNGLSVANGLPKLQDWWKTFTTPQARIAEVNKLIKTNQLNPNEVKDVTITENDKNGVQYFTFTVSLNDYFVFSDGKSSWTSLSDNSIKYNIQIATPQTNITADHIGFIGDDQTASAWINSLGTDVRERLDLINPLLKAPLDLSVIQNIQFIVFDENQKTIDATINLNDGYIFSNGQNLWNWSASTSSNTPIQYFTRLPLSPEVKTSLLPIPIKGAKDPSDGWAKTYPTVAEQVNIINQQMLNVSTQLDPNKVDHTIASYTSGNTFAVTVYLKVGFTFKDNKISWQATNIPFSLQVALPQLINKTGSQLIAFYENVNDWEAKTDLTGKISELNKLLKPGTLLEDDLIVHNSVQSITVASVSNERNFTLVVTLKDGYVFENIGGKVWTSDIIHFVSEVKEPAIKAGVEFTGSQFTAQEWWDSLGKTTVEKINALNKYVTPVTTIDPKVVENIDFSPKSDHWFSLEFQLTSDHVFPNNKPTLDQIYFYYTQVMTPTVMESQHLMVPGQTNARTWWDSFKGDVAKQVEALNQYIFTANKLDPKVVKSVDINYQSQDTVCSFKINLASRCQFEDGKTTLTTHDFMFNF